MGNAKVFNMIVLGAFLKVKPVVKLENVVKGLQKSLPERAHRLIPMNEQAILCGMEIVEEQKALASFSSECGTPR
ncbi:MAG: 2-oxoacid:acceptor oxidoreductase family protein, partial [Prevotellaceae bacterium]|jgi:2-oxoglutarate ferredoxin oxidoreductase subunit gamma|nr:2-oxoacid:acceptor oxidoreductase family protein [Prevotellaceae bacterium]